MKDFYWITYLICTQIRCWSTRSSKSYDEFIKKSRVKYLLFVLHVESSRALVKESIPFFHSTHFLFDNDIYWNWGRFPTPKCLILTKNNLIPIYYTDCGLWSTSVSDGGHRVEGRNIKPEERIRSFVTV